MEGGEGIGFVVLAGEVTDEWKRDEMRSKWCPAVASLTLSASSCLFEDRRKPINVFQPMLCLIISAHYLGLLIFWCIVSKAKDIENA